MREAHHFSQVLRVHADLPGVASQLAESNPRVIWRHTRRERDAAEVRNLLLVGAVPVHGPDFLVAGAVANEIDLGLSWARNAAQLEDDLVGELVRNVARVLHAGCFLILL